MKGNRINYLIRGYYLDSLSTEEWAEFSIVLQQISFEELENSFLELMHDESNADSGVQMNDEIGFEVNLQKILTIDKIEEVNLPDVPVRKSAISIVYSLGAVAASILLILFVGHYVWNLKETKELKSVEAISTEGDLLPGQDGGVLTLSSGKTINLETLPEGELVTSENENVAVSITRTKANYSIIQQIPVAKLVYQQIETPKGRRFKVGLSDGTTVWLNAGSKLRFPVQFAEDHRDVFLSGEAYFEVAHDADKPFRVRFEHMKNSHIAVLGTKFNVRSYLEDHDMTTTLFEGKVRVYHNKNALLLQPGEIAVSSAEGAIRLMKSNNLRQAIAWKDNYFHFEQADLPTLMAELSRWYDFEVVFPENIPQELYSGKIDKSLTFNQIIKILGGANLKYRLEPGRKVVIIE